MGGWLADFLAVMDSLCSGEGGAAFHTRLRGALRRWSEMREELQLAAAAGSPASSDGTMTGSEGEEEQDPFTEWSMLEPFATGDLREVVRRHSGGDAAGWRSTDSEGEGEESESESHERRLVLRHLARMLGDREHGPAVRPCALPCKLHCGGILLTRYVCAAHAPHRGVHPSLARRTRGGAAAGHGRAIGLPL